MVHYSSEMLSENPWWENCRPTDGSLQADGVSYQAYYSEVGKAHYMGKDLTEVRSSQRKLVPDNVGLGQYEQTSLRGIATKAKAHAKHRFQDLYRFLNARFLMLCWKDLNKDAASGVDRVTAEAYEENLEANIRNLAKSLKDKRYRAKLVRRCYIPKENGKERPLGIPVLEDRLVQLACAKILASIFEADFVDTSYGYRPNRSAREAIEDLQFNLHFGKFGYIVEADIKGFFDNIDHDWLLRMLHERIDDAAFLNLIRKWLKAGILDTDGKVIDPETGTPQGGIVSPVLANVYLHFVLDLWFEKLVKVKLRTARKKLQGACRRIKEWIKENRHLKGVGFIKALNRKLQGHFNYYNVPGNLHALWRFYRWAVECAFKWLNRRGGKRKSFSWSVFARAIDRLGIARPKMVKVNRKHRVFA
jgi:retron-type reverse transcriptase